MPLNRIIETILDNSKVVISHDTTLDRHEEKILGMPIGGFRGNKVPRDGDGDGMFTLNDEDNVPMPKAINIIRNLIKSRKPKYVSPDKSRKESIKRILEAGRDGGFTADQTAKNDVVSGISVGRNRHGIKLQKDDVFDENGMPKEEAIALVAAWMEYHGQDVFDSPLNGAREVGIGGWLDGDDFYLDVVDIYENTPENIARAASLGKEQNQISVANLDQIQIALKTGNWDGTTIDSGGDGADTMDISMFADMADAFMSAPRSQQKRGLMALRGRKKSLFDELTSHNSVRIIITDDKKRIING